MTYCAFPFPCHPCLALPVYGVVAATVCPCRESQPDLVCPSLFPVVNRFGSSAMVVFSYVLQLRVPDAGMNLLLFFPKEGRANRRHYLGR